MDEPSRRTYGQNIARAIAQLEQKYGRTFTQEEIAKRMGKARQGGLPQLKKKKSAPTPKIVLRDAKALECTPGELLEGIPFPHDDLRGLTLRDSADKNGPSQSEEARTSTQETSGKRTAETLAGVEGRAPGWPSFDLLSALSQDARDAVSHFLIDVAARIKADPGEPSKAVQRTGTRPPRPGQRRARNR